MTILFSRYLAENSETQKSTQNCGLSNSVITISLSIEVLTRLPKKKTLTIKRKMMSCMYFRMIEALINRWEMDRRIDENWYDAFRKRKDIAQGWELRSDWYYLGEERKKKTNKKINHYITCIRIWSSNQVRAPTNRVQNFVDFTRGSAVFVVSWLIPGRTLKCFIWSICEILYLWNLALLNTVCFYQIFQCTSRCFIV